MNSGPRCERSGEINEKFQSVFMLSYDVVRWGRPLEKTERDTPKPKGTEVLVRLKYCGVCHSDAHIRDGYFDLGGGRRLHMGERGMRPPVTLGHEPFGTVIAAGPKALDAPIGAADSTTRSCSCGSSRADRSLLAVGSARAGAAAGVGALRPKPRHTPQTATAATISKAPIEAFRERAVIAARIAPAGARTPANSD